MSLILPVPGSDAGVWGVELNTALTQLDTTKLDAATASGTYLSQTDATATYPPVKDPTAAAAQQAANSGAVTVALTGHSLIYGQDTTGTGTTAATNGASQTRSSTPPTAVFQTQSGYTCPGTVTIVNQGYPGDRSTEALTRWSGGSSGKIEIFWIDVNDGINAGGLPGGTLTDAQTAANLAALVQRSRARGAEVVVIGGSPTTDMPNSRAIYASAQTNREIAERYGARYLDAGELLAALPRSVGLFSTAPHLTPQAYALIGARLAALVGPKGVNPPKVAPGRVITPRDMVHNGGTLTTRAGTADGQTLLINAGSAVTIPFDVTAPCVAVVRFYYSGTTIGYGTVGMYYGLGQSGRPTRYSKLIASTSATAFAYVRAMDFMSPGPDSLVINCESGTLEIDSITFIPVDTHKQFSSGDTFDVRKSRAMNLHPVGGQASRSDSGWDAMIDPTNTVSLRSGSAQTTKANARWLWDLNLGASSNGVILTQGVVTGGTAFLIANGYMVLRDTSNLILRKYDGGAVTDTTVAATFAASGTLRVLMEIDYNAGTDIATLYIDGTSKATFTPAWTSLTPGLIAAGTGTVCYSAGTGLVYSENTEL
jgi:hypothetical protein